MLYTPSQDKKALAGVPQREIRKTKTDESERDRHKCDYCMKTGHIREKCWKLDGCPTLGRGGRNGSSRPQAYRSETTDHFTPI